MAPPVVDNPHKSRFETMTPHGIGVLVYERSGGRLSLNHTEVPEADRDRGIGTRLVEAAFQEARDRGLTVVPRCPFVRAYVEQHPEVSALIANSE
ncbi:MAG TPA: GNAT family N-acetyltransferase [Candidatus Eisenbacteria bacterium]|nr:GNAT family N-acetyltransferase [Candidatus Eisenbacteria bacterium]